MNNFDLKKTNKITEGKKLPSVILRKCIACGKITDRNNLVRILSDYKNGEIIINPSNNDFGKSKYLCKNEECLKLAIKKKRLKNLTDEKISILQKLISSK